MRPCADCRRAADAYTRSCIRNFMRDAAPRESQTRRAVVKVARALHELHVLRGGRRAR